MSDTRDEDRLDVDVPDDPEGKTKAGTAEQSAHRHAEGSLDIFDGSAPERAALPNDRPWLAPDAPGGGPRETVDPRANTPEGHEVEGKLTDFNDGFGRDIPTGTNHHGVGTTYDQDKKVGDENDIEQMLHPSGPAKPPPPPGQGGQGDKGTGGSVGTAGGSEKGGGSIAGGGQGSPPPGAELGFRAPKWDQVSDDNLKGLMPNIFGPDKKAGPSRDEQIQKQKEALGGTKPDAGTPVIPEYKPKDKKMTDGESGPVPEWVPAAEGTPVNKGDWVSQPVNPDLGGGDGGDPAIDPAKGPVGGVKPGVIDKDPDYQEVSVPSAPPAVKPGDEVSKPVNPDDLPPTLAPSGSGPGSGGGQPEGRAGVPDVSAAAPTEVAPPAAAEPAPAPTADQQLAPPDFEGPPAQGAPEPGEAGDGGPDGDGLPG